MDFGATISRAVKIVRENKILWVLGFLTALGGATNAFGNGSRTSWRFDGRDLASGRAGLPWVLPDWMLQPGVMAAGIGALVLFAFVLGLAVYVVGVIARGGLITSVNQIEREGKTTFKAAWSAGAAKFWSLLGLTLLLFLPFIVIGVIAAIAIVTSSVAVFAPAIRGNEMSQGSMVAGGLAVGTLVLSLACAAIAYGLVALGLQTLGERAIMLDNLPVMEALRKARTLLRANLGNIILLALLVFLIDVAVSVVTGLIAAALFAPTFAALAMNQTPQTVVMVLGGLGVVAALLVSALIGSVFSAFNSTVWTLAYEQFTGTLTVTPTTPAAPLTHPA